MITKNEFFDRYNNVFDTAGNIKVCGREKCKDLIRACAEMDRNKPVGYYGNENTGMMNVENISALHNSLVKFLDE